MVGKYKLTIRTLFLIDGAGAFLTAFCLLVILRPFNEYIGMPERDLIGLSLVAAGLCIYSFTCFFSVKSYWKPFLRILAVANLLYCCLTLGLVIYNYVSLTRVGLAYFLIEIAVIFVLVAVEWKTGKKETMIKPVRS